MPPLMGQIPTIQPTPSVEILKLALEDRKLEEIDHKLQYLASARDSLQRVAKKINETFREFAQHWRYEIAKVIPPLTDNEILTTGEQIEDRLKAGIIVDFQAIYKQLEQVKTSSVGSTSKKFVPKGKREDEEALSHIFTSHAKAVYNVANVSYNHQPQLQYTPAYKPATYSQRKPNFSAQALVWQQFPPANQPRQSLNFQSLIYDSQAICEYHNVVGHGAEHCASLKHRIQDLIDEGTMDMVAFDEVERPMLENASFWSLDELFAILIDGWCYVSLEMEELRRVALKSQDIIITQYVNSFINEGCRDALGHCSELSAKGHSVSNTQIKMASFHDAREFQGNQGGEEEVDVLSVEPIAMIVMPDAPTISTEVEAVLFEGWESKVMNGRLDNLRKAPKTIPAGFRFRAALHHKVANGAGTVKGFKKLEEMVRQYQIPRTILIRAGTPNEWACSVLRMGWVLVYVDHFDTGDGLQVALPMPSVPLHQWDEMVLHLEERKDDWHTPNAYMNYPQLTVGDVDLKNQLLDHVRARGLVDLETLVTSEQLALLGILERQRQQAQGSRNHGAGSGSQRQTRFDKRPSAASGRSSSHRSSSSAPRQCAEQRVEPMTLGSRRRAWEDSDAEDDIPLIWRRMSTGSQPASAITTWLANLPSALAPTSSSVSGPKIAYSEGFSYVRTDCQTAMVQEKESGIQVAKEEAGRAEDRAKKAEFDREKALYEMHSLKDRVVEADQHVARAKASLEQNAIIVASANTTTNIFNEIRGKVLRKWADFPINKLAFFEGEEMDEQGKSLAPPKGLPMWPPSIVEEGKDTEGLPSFDAWVADPQEVPAKPSSTPLSSQPALAPVLSPPDGHLLLDLLLPVRSRPSPST
ncbi:hypothetical protein SLEP1_g39561 [Rubroshorea leprosula]|uniref:Uncharacterized protein n=1 Tax=Rubroshorea leprosula TaxID=152421 RepID=A0AAV5L0K5_9ROSI|nr:hypothetical protein SLEP1_g39561 [Rubroshorea leprosula]